MDLETTGSYEAENEESLIERTSCEGQATGFTLGLSAEDLPGIGQEPAEETDHELDEELEDGTSTSVRVPPKSDVAKESALEARFCFVLRVKYNALRIVFHPNCQAVENVGDVMSNLLKVQGKLEQIRDKLAPLKTSESEEILSKT